jgi:23S rRNA pseudouridine2605 synthase
MERLQKRIANSGLCSRRKAEEYIKEGRVKVNGEVITEMGVKVSPSDTILVDDNPLPVLIKTYLVMNKPVGVLSSTTDDRGRKTVISILPQEYQGLGLYPVGRLDYDTKGVLLITNDGDFMNTLIGPKSNLKKEYLARIDGIITKEEVKNLAQGVYIDAKKTRKCDAKIIDIDKKNKSSLVSITLVEGNYHQVKNMFLALGYNVKKLTRVKFGEVEIGNLSPGEIRELKPHEIKRLVVLSKFNLFNVKK